MAITTVLFDLDGTLLPMDLDVFLRTYFGSLGQYMEQYGYEKEKLLKTIWSSTDGMIHNTTGQPNAEVFRKRMEQVYGDQFYVDEDKFDAFYREGFPKVRVSCGFTPAAAEVIALCKEKGLRRILATNPFFPETATHQRIGWAGLQVSDFELVTTYDNSCGCKPNPAYYQEILRKQGLKAEECLMVGNDVQEDMMAKDLGMSVFLLTPCLIDRNHTDLSQYPHGGYEELMDYIRSLK